MIPLPTKAELEKLLSYDPATGELRWRVKLGPKSAVGKLAGAKSNGYYKVGIHQTLYFAHRLIWKMMTGADPAGGVDHRDGNRANNIWSNLREATQQENCRNTKIRSDNRTGRKGVQRRPDTQKNPWRARLTVNGKMVWHASFPTLEEASAARNEAARKFHGEFARAA